MREFYKERNVVMEERRMRTDSSPTGRLVEQFLGTAFMANPVSPSDHWLRLRPADLLGHRRRRTSSISYYVPSNMVIGLVGDLDPDQVMPIVERYFGQLPAAPKPAELNTVEPPQNSVREVKLQDPSQPFYLEGYHRPSYLDPDDAVYDAITDIMSNGRTSRLYRSLVRDQKIAASAAGFTGFPGNKYATCSRFTPCRCPATRHEEMQKAIHEEIDKLKTQDVTDEELQMFKTRTKADLIRGLASNEGLAQQLAIYQTRYGDWRELFRYLDKRGQGDQGRHPARGQPGLRRTTTARSEPSRPRPRAASRAAARQRSGQLMRAQTIAFRASVVLLSCCCMTRLQLRSKSRRGTEFQSPPLPAFKPQEPVRIQLPNGMVIFLQPDHELPLISATATHSWRLDLRAREQDRPGRSLRRCLAHRRHQDQDRRPDGRLPRSPRRQDRNRRRRDSTTISLNCLKGDFDAVFEMFLDLLHNPEFRDDKLELAKQQMYTGISRRNDDVDSIVARESRILAYGKDNPYARVPEYATVAAVTREDLLNWHQQYVHPNNIIFGITGDFDPKAMEAKLRQAFESWPKGPEAKEPDIKFTEPKPGIYFVQKTDVNQSTHRHGRPRHRAQQSRLLRRHRDERDLRRRILLAAVQQHARQPRDWPIAWAAAWASCDHPGLTDIRDADQERDHGRRHSRRCTKKLTRC